MKIMFVGDVNLGEYYPSFGNGPGTFSKKKSVFSAVEELFSDADLVVGNLEAVISTEGNDPKDPERMVLKADPAIAHHLKDAGFRVMQVANNHTVQHGEAAFQECLSILEDMEISAVGLNQQKPVVLEHNGLKIGFLAASDVPDNTDKQQALYQRLDESFFSIVEDSVKAVDHLIVMLHWGLEASTTPMAYQRETAERLRTLGVTAIIGSHPHLFYEIESYDDFVCAYSLGNFVFDLAWEERLTKSGILELDLEAGRINGQVWPVKITQNGCFPVVSGPAVPLSQKVVIYDLGASLEWQQTKKVIFLIAHILKGNTYLKLKFFFKKFRVFCGLVGSKFTRSKLGQAK